MAHWARTSTGPVDPCHVYGRIAQALAVEDMTLPPTDWSEHEKNRLVQRDLFANR